MEHLESGQEKGREHEEHRRIREQNQQQKYYVLFKDFKDRVERIFSIEAEGYRAGPTRRPAWLAGWRRVTHQGVILYVMDGPCRLR